MTALPGRKSDAAASAPPVSADEGAPNWRRTLAVMIALQLAMNAGFTVLSPIMPLFLPKIGISEQSQIDLWAGILAFITPLLAAGVSPIWGRVADQRGRKLMVLRSCLAIGVCIGLMSLAQNVWQLFGLRALMGVFAGFNAATIALVATQVPTRRLGYALGWLSTGQLVGGLVGPLAGGVVADMTGSYRVPFALTSVICLSCGGAVFALVRERFTPPKPGAARRSFIQSFAILGRTPGLVALFVVLLLAQFAVTAVQPVVTVYVEQLVGNQGNIATLGGLAFSITGAADLLASPFLGRRSDTIGYRRVLLICLAGAALASVPQFLAVNYWTFLVGRFGLGLFVGGILPTANALVGRLSPAADRGAVYGATASAMYLGGSLGPLSGGGIAAAVGVRWVFLVVAILLAINLAWVWAKVPEIN